jgi:hypothetical protein
MPKITAQKGGQTSKASVLPQWEDITGLDPWVKACLYGRSGTGKTTFYATFPGPIGTMICSGAGETKSIRNVPGVQAVRLTHYEQLLGFVEQQRKDMKFKTFVLDHASGYQDLVLKYVLGRQELPQQLSWGFAGREEWGKVASIMKECLIQMLRLDCHVVIVAQERAFNTDEDSSGGVLAPYVNAALSPSVAGWLGPQVDYLLETFLKEETKMEKTKIQGHEIEQEVKTGKVQFCLRTAPHPVYETKFRLPRGTPLPPFIVDPSYDKIAKLIAGAPLGAKVSTVPTASKNGR